MNKFESNTTVLANTTPTSERKTYKAPTLRDLDSIEKTEGGASIHVFEMSGGAITS